MRRILRCLLIVLVAMTLLVSGTSCTETVYVTPGPTASRTPTLTSTPTPTSIATTTPARTAEPTATPASEPAPAQTPQPTSPPRFSTYVDSAGYFSVSYPSTWELFPAWAVGLTAKDFFVYYDPLDESLSGLYFIVFMAYSPRDSQGRLASVNIVVRPTAGLPQTVTDLIYAQIHRNRETGVQYVELSLTDEVIDEKAVTIVDWEESVDGSGEYRTLQMLFVVDNLLWKVTCGAASEAFADYETDFYDILTNLKTEAPPS